MDFKEWLAYWEAYQWGYMGPLEIILGTGESQRLHYGTSRGMSPMLYVPLKGESKGDNEWSSIIKSIRKWVDKHGFHCEPDDKAYGGYRCEMIPPETGQKDVGEENKADIMWTGESHITVAYGNELEKAAGEQGIKVVQMLQEASDERLGPLFHETRGCPMPVYKPMPKDIQLKYGPAHLFTTPVGTPPIAVILPVVCPNVAVVREVLGLPNKQQGYTTHVTIGYVIPKKAEGGVLTTMGKGKKAVTARGVANQDALAMAGQQV